MSYVYMCMDENIATFTAKLRFYNYRAQMAWRNTPADVQQALIASYPYAYPPLPVYPGTGKRTGDKYTNYVRQQYYARVWACTQQHELTVPPGYNIDHIVPIILGFIWQIPPHLIGGLDNLQIILHTDNGRKKDILTSEGKRLLQRWKYGVPKELVGTRVTHYYGHTHSTGAPWTRSAPTNHTKPARNTGSCLYARA